MKNAGTIHSNTLSPEVQFSKLNLIFQTHNRVELLTLVSVSDITCIVQAGFCTYRSDYQEEDGDRAMVSRRYRCLDRTSTLWHDNTQGVFFPGWCVRVQ